MVAVEPPVQPILAVEVVAVVLLVILQGQELAAMDSNHQSVALQHITQVVVADFSGKLVVWAVVELQLDQQEQQEQLTLAVVEAAAADVIQVIRQQSQAD
jgi:hypothetical protein